MSKLDPLEPANKVVFARNRLGVASRGSDPDAIADARRELAAAKLEAYVAKVVAEAPPLSPEQRDRIALLFRAPIGGDAA
jgi:hypothetical protein